MYKTREKWTIKQALLAQVLFKEYPNIEKAYELSQELRSLFNTKSGKLVAFTKLAHWYDKVEKVWIQKFWHYNEYY